MIPERIGDILAHVFLHDIHHRGQVHAMLSGTSVAPPQLDEFLLDYDREAERARRGRAAGLEDLAFRRMIPENSGLGSAADSGST